LKHGDWGGSKSIVAVSKVRRNQKGPGSRTFKEREEEQIAERGVIKERDSKKGESYS